MPKKEILKRLFTATLALLMLAGDGLFLIQAQESITLAGSGFSKGLPVISRLNADPATDFSLDVTNGTVNVLDCFNLNVTLIGGSEGVPEYKTSNKKVAIVIGSGLAVRIYGLKAGKAKITVIVNGIKKTVAVKVRAKKMLIKVTSPDYSGIRIDFLEDFPMVDGYQILRSNKKSSGFKLIDTQINGSFGTTDWNVDVGKTYYYKVKAFLLLGTTTYYVTSTVKKGKATIDKPAGLTLSVPVPTDSTLKAKVTVGVDGSDGYQFRYDTKKNGKYKKYMTVATDEVIFTKLKGGKDYWVKARAYRVVGGKKVFGKYSDPQKLFVPKAFPNIEVSNMCDPDGPIPYGYIEPIHISYVKFDIKNVGAFPLVLKNTIGWGSAADLPDFPGSWYELELRDAKYKKRNSITIDPGKKVTIIISCGFNDLRWDDVFAIVTKYEGRQFYVGIQYDTYLGSSLDGIAAPNPEEEETSEFTFDMSEYEVDFSYE